jgi:hypothetical protein
LPKKIVDAIQLVENYGARGDYHAGLLKAVAYRKDGQTVKNAGMLARVMRGGWVSPGDEVVIR